MEASDLRAFHLSLPVADLEPAVDFYVSTLGCERRRSGDDWVDIDFYGNQLSLHEVPGYRPETGTCIVDGVSVPVRHHGIVLDPKTWRSLAERLSAGGAEFVLTPRSRFVGQLGEQHTFFIADPSGNAMEVKAFPQGVWT